MLAMLQLTFASEAGDLVPLSQYRYCVAMFAVNITRISDQTAPFLKLIQLRCFRVDLRRQT